MIGDICVINYLFCTYCSIIYILGCLEIKCTFKHHNSSILQACADDRNLCLQVTDGK